MTNRNVRRESGVVCRTTEASTRIGSGFLISLEIKTPCVAEVQQLPVWTNHLTDAPVTCFGCLTDGKAS